MKYIHELKVGIVTVIAIVVFIITVYCVQKISLKKKGYEIDVIFNKVAGLTAGSKVFLSGVIVGEVKSIYLRKDAKVNVTLLINPKVKIKENSIFVITVSSPLAVEKIIEIIPQPGKAAYLKPKSKVIGEEPLEIRELLLSVHKTFTQFMKISNTLNELLKKGEVETHLIEILQNVNNASKNIDLLTQNLNKDYQEGDIRVILNNIKNISNKLDKTSDEILKLAEDKKLKKDIKEIISSLKDTTNRINEVTKKLQQGVFKDENIKDITETLNETNKITKEITDKINKLKKIDIDTHLNVTHLKDFDRWQTNLSLVCRSSLSPIYYKLGINDLTEDNKFNLIIGRRKDKLTTEVGIIDGKLGLGVGYTSNPALECKVINPNSLYVNCEAGLMLSPNLYLIYGSYKKNKDTERDTFIGIKAIK